MGRADSAMRPDRNGAGDQLGVPTWQVINWEAFAKSGTTSQKDVDVAPLVADGVWAYRAALSGPPLAAPCVPQRP